MSRTSAETVAGPAKGFLATLMGLGGGFDPPSGQTTDPRGAPTARENRKPTLSDGTRRIDNPLESPVHSPPPATAADLSVLTMAAFGGAMPAGLPDGERLVLEGLAAEANGNALAEGEAVVSRDESDPMTTIADRRLNFNPVGAGLPVVPDLGPGISGRPAACRGGVLNPENAGFRFRLFLPGPLGDDPQPAGTAIEPGEHRFSMSAVFSGDRRRRPAACRGGG